MNLSLITETIKALSWKEPYGTLMLYGKIETRVWKTSYRGLVLICASKKSYNLGEVFRISGGDLYRAIWNKIFPDKNKYSVNVSDNLFYCGKAFAIGELIDCRPMRKEDEDKCFVRYYPDLYCHVYQNVTKIEPFFWKGSLGFKTLTDYQKSQIKII